MKGEVDGCDLVAVRGDEPPVIVELKAGFSLALVFQGIARQRLAENVYLPVPPFSRRAARGKGRLGPVPAPRPRTACGPARARAALEEYARVVTEL